MKQNTLINELSAIRKQMGLPLNDNYDTLINEILTPYLILEGPELKGAVSRVIKIVFPSLAEKTDEIIDAALKDCNVTLPGGNNQPIKSLDDLADWAQSSKAKVNNSETDEAYIKRTLESKTSDPVTELKRQIKTSLNRMDMSSTVDEIKTNKGKINTSTSKSGVKFIPGVPDKITVNGITYDVKAPNIEVSTVDDIIEHLEVNFLGKEVGTTDEKWVSNPSWVDKNISSRDVNGLDSIISSIETNKKIFSDGCDTITKKVDEMRGEKPNIKIVTTDNTGVITAEGDKYKYKVQKNATTGEDKLVKSLKEKIKWEVMGEDETKTVTERYPKNIIKIEKITADQAEALKTSINTLKVKGEEIFDRSKTLYENAKKNEESVASSEKITAEKEGGIFDLEEKLVILRGAGDNEDHMLDTNGKWWKGDSRTNTWTIIDDLDEIERIKTTHAEELRNHFVNQKNQLIKCMIDNAKSESLGVTGRGVSEWFSRFFRSFPLFNWSIFKGPTQEAVRFWKNNKRMIARSGNLLDPLKEIYSESSGRYSFAEVKLRLEYLMNEMQEVIKRAGSQTVKNGDNKISDNTTKRLNDLFMEMQDIASNRKFAGDVEGIKGGVKDIADNSRIINTTEGLEFVELKTIADSFEEALKLAKENKVQGADQLYEYWTKGITEGGYNKINMMGEFLETLDKKDMSSKRPGWTLDKELRDSLLPYLKEYGKEGRAKRASAKLAREIEKKQSLKKTSENGTTPFAQESEVITEAAGWIKGLKSTAKFIKVTAIDVVLKGLYNQFRYAHFTSIDEINRITTIYGPNKGRIVIAIREMITHVVIDALISALYSFALVLDLVIGVFNTGGWDGDRPGHRALLTAMGYADDLVPQKAEWWKAEKEKFSEWYTSDYGTIMWSFFDNPVNLKSLLPIGIISNFYNLIEWPMGTADDNPDFFTVKPEYGWYESEVDEAIILTAGMVKDLYDSTGSGDSNEQLQIAEAFKSKLEEKTASWKKTGSEFGMEKLNDILNNEKNIKDGIDKVVEGGSIDNFPKELGDNLKLYNKFKKIIALERYPEPEPKTDVARTESDVANLKKSWEKWYSDHSKNVGITDLKGKFWRIDKGTSLVGSPIEWFDGKNNGTIINNGGFSQQSDYFIKNPDDKKLYNLRLVGEFFSNADIEKIYAFQTRGSMAEISEDQFNTLKATYDSDRKQLVYNITTLQSFIKKSCGSGSIYTVSCHKWNTRLSGGTVMEGGVVKDYGKGYIKHLTKMDSDFKTAKETYEKNKKSIPTRVPENKSLSYSNIINEYLSLNNIHQPKMRNLKSKLIESKRFDQDDYKHWKDTFTFQAVDEKNPGKYKDVKLNMDDVMDRIPHYRKKYDEDDSFVRAVVDTHENVVRLMFTKDLANIREWYTPTGFAMILQQIREGRGEMEIWSVARPASGNWFLVKGDFTPKELTGMDLEKNEPADKEPKKRENSLETLKKKELTSAQGLKNDERSGFNELPKILKQKLKEKFNNGWTTEEPPKKLQPYYTNSEISSVFGDNIKIYKLNASEDFFNLMTSSSEGLPIKRGFCRSIQLSKNNENLTDEHMVTIKHILNVCKNKFNGMLGISNIQ